MAESVSLRAVRHCSSPPSKPFVCLLLARTGLPRLLGVRVLFWPGGARLFHQAAIRLPLLALATAIALFNLWMLLNTWRLRRAPTAQWRLRPLPASKRRQIALIVALSLLTLVIVGAELFVHHKLHGSAFAGTLPTQTNRYSVSRHDFPLMRTTDIQKPAVLCLAKTLASAENQ